MVNGGMKLESAAKESNKTHGDDQRNDRKQEQERELSKQRNCPLSVLLKAPRSCKLFVKGLVAVFGKLTLIKCSMNAKLAGLNKERGTSLAQRARVLLQQHFIQCSLLDYSLDKANLYTARIQLIPIMLHKRS